MNSIPSRSVANQTGSRGKFLGNTPKILENLTGETVDQTTRRKETYNFDSSDFTAEQTQDMPSEENRFLPLQKNNQFQKEKSRAKKRPWFTFFLWL